MTLNRVRRKGSYAPLSAHYYLDDEVARVGEAAELLFVRSLAFCAATLSDGFVGDSQLVRGPGAGLQNLTRRVRQLLDAGLWERVEGGYRVAAWLEWNWSREEIHAAMERDAKRKSKDGAGPGGPSGSARTPSGFRAENHAASNSGDSATNFENSATNFENSATNFENSGVANRDHVLAAPGVPAERSDQQGYSDFRAESSGFPSASARIPRLARAFSRLTPDVLSSGDLVGGGPVANGREFPDPPRRCPEHENHDGPVPRCGACRDARLAAEQWDAARPDPAATERQTRRSAINACTQCDEHGFIEIEHDEPHAQARAVRCTHGQPRRLAVVNR